MIKSGLKKNARRAFRIAKGVRRRAKEYLSVAKNYHFSVDSPRKVLQEDRNITIDGWIVPKVSRKFKLRIRNNKQIYPVDLTIKRADVEKTYPKLPSSVTLLSGFEKEITFEDGTLSIEINEGRGYKTLYSTQVRFSTENLPDTLYNKDLSINYPEHVNLIENRQKFYYEDRLDGSYSRSATDPRLVAIYLPQFHPFAENDKAWGRGFTEWTNVTTAQPRFVGHQQPILPKDLGFYDLRLEEKLLEQIELAKKYGVYGFSFYYYWFSGKKLMDGPLNTLLKHKDWDFNFVICWANENWTKRWDGRNSEVIIAQEYRDEDPLEFIKDVEDILLDERYITEDGKPVLTVYRASELKDPKKYVKVWRDYFKKKHGKELHLVSYLSFDAEDPRTYGFDAALEFAPHSAFFKNDLFTDSKFPYLDIRDKLLDINFSGTVADYRTIALNGKLDMSYDFPVYPCVTPSWDNDSRKKGKGFVYQNSSPDIYATWLERVVGKALKNQSAPLVFLNAWNEWAEGAMLEPSIHLGHAALNRTAEVLSKFSANTENQIVFPGYATKKTPKKLAIIVHLYYTDLWEQIVKRLELIDEPFDIFVTLNERDEDFKPTIDKKNVNVTTYTVPNRGRDVLPFLYVLRRIQESGYEYVLKIHSKKSKHRTDGSDWFTDLLDSLLSASTVKQVVQTLSKPSTGLVGPTGHLVSLKRHMGSNKPIVEHLLVRLYGKGTTEKVLKSPAEYPYFGGTMFWARMEALSPIAKLHLMPDDFHSEHGQIDGTTAHAVERLIGIVAKLENKELFEAGIDGVNKSRDWVDEKYTHAP